MFSYDKEVSTPNYLRYIPACDFTDTTNATHYGIDYDKRFEFDSTNQVSINNVKGADGGSRAWNYITNSQVGSRTNDVFIYKFYNMNQISYNPLDYINYSASIYYNEFVLKKEGIPLIKVDEPCTIEIPLNFVNSTGRCTVSIRKSRFSADTPKTTKESDDLYWNDNVPSGDLDVIKIEQTDSAETTYWLKVLPNNENATSIVSLYGKIKKVIQ